MAVRPDEHYCIPQHIPPQTPNTPLVYIALFPFTAIISEINVYYYNPHFPCPYLEIPLISSSLPSTKQSPATSYSPVHFSQPHPTLPALRPFPHLPVILLLLPPLHTRLPGPQRLGQPARHARRPLRTLRRLSPTPIPVPVHRHAHRAVPRRRWRRRFPPSGALGRRRGGRGLGFGEGEGGPVDDGLAGGWRGLRGAEGAWGGGGGGGFFFEVGGGGPALAGAGEFFGEPPACCGFSCVSSCMLGRFRQGGEGWNLPLPSFCRISSSSSFWMDSSVVPLVPPKSYRTR